MMWPTPWCMWWCHLPYPLLLVDRHACENITLPQLLLRVIMTDRHDWKHSFRQTTCASGKNTKFCICFRMSVCPSITLRTQWHLVAKTGYLFNCSNFWKHYLPATSLAGGIGELVLQLFGWCRFDVMSLCCSTPSEVGRGGRLIKL